MRKLHRAQEEVKTKEITDFEKSWRVFWGRILQIKCNIKSLWEYIQGKVLKRNKWLTYTLFALNFPDSHPIFKITRVNYGDEVENHILFKKENVHTHPRQVSLAQ